VKICLSTIFDGLVDLSDLRGFQGPVERSDLVDDIPVALHKNLDKVAELELCQSSTLQIALEARL
jgi:hypothetical protein